LTTDLLTPLWKRTAFQPCQNGPDTNRALAPAPQELKAGYRNLQTPPCLRAPWWIWSQNAEPPPLV